MYQRQFAVTRNVAEGTEFEFDVLDNTTIEKIDVTSIDIKDGLAVPLFYAFQWKQRNLSSESSKNGNTALPIIQEAIGNNHYRAEYRNPVNVYSGDGNKSRINSKKWQFYLLFDGAVRIDPAAACIRFLITYRNPVNYTPVLDANPKFIEKHNFV